MSDDHVPITQLKANLAAYLKDVKDGRSFVVTDHGTPVGILSPVARIEQVPLPTFASKIDHYLAEARRGRFFLITEGGVAVGIVSHPDWEPGADKVCDEWLTTEQIPPFVHVGE